MSSEPAPRTPAAVSEPQAVADLARGRNIARTVAAVAVSACLVLALAFGIVVWNQHANDVYLHGRADVNDARWCALERRLDMPPTDCH